MGSLPSESSSSARYVCIYYVETYTCSANDLVIALMGMTGSGKSSLISLCTNQQVEIGHDLQSCTQDVRTYTFCHPKLRSGRIYLVDTPGFDDTNRSDTEVLRTLAAWLTTTYSSGIKLSGILYLHRINQTRMQGSALKNISLFRSLCGDDSLKKVLLVTTMWDIAEGDIAESRERQLKETKKYWGGMVAKGSQVIRHDNTRQSAFALIETFINYDSKIVLNIQSEMVDDHKPLERTEVGNDIKEILAEQNEKLRRDIQQVEFELREALKKKDEEFAEALKEARLEHQQALKQVLDNQQRLQATMQQLYESKPAKLEDIKLEEESQPSYNLLDGNLYSPNTNTTTSSRFSGVWGWPEDTEDKSQPSYNLPDGKLYSPNTNTIVSSGVSRVERFPETAEEWLCQRRGGVDRIPETMEEWLWQRRRGV
ncbi:P-loop containing nucleoside triphosphate hydrolase protein [Xylaria flabelliformis]|nr:P-loop containing nucleoside triphosphate hydrolase protein [Xylaria flabelliformis]